MILNPLFNTIGDIALGAMEADVERSRIRANKQVQLEEIHLERKRLEMIDAHLREYASHLQEHNYAGIVAQAHQLARAGEDRSLLLKRLCDPDLPDHVAERLEGLLLLQQDHQLAISRALAESADKSAALAVQSAQSLPFPQPRLLVATEEG